MADDDKKDTRASELALCGVYYIVGELSDESLAEVMRDVLLKRATGWDGALQLVINSAGGECSAVWALIDVLGRTGLEVRTIGVGMCCSAAATLLASGTKGKRFAGANTAIMIHEAKWSGIEGNSSDLASMAAAAESESGRDVSHWRRVSRYRREADVRKHLLKPSDVWLSAEDALRHGIIDGIL